MKTAIVITMIGDSFVAFMNSRKEWDVLEVCFEANETPIYSDFNNFIKDYAVYTNSKSVFYIGDYTYKKSVGHTIIGVL